MNANPDALIVPELSGVPETLLMTVWSRAAYAKGPDDLLDDPLARSLVERIDYDFRHSFGKPSPIFAIRSRYGDERLRTFLERHPSANVVVLGEGLESQLWRVDNGMLQWFSVDLPESIDLRTRLLPRHPRNTLLRLSALDRGWMESVDRSGDGPVFISAAGLFMYFEESQVVELLRDIVAHFRHGELFFDSIPPWFSRKTLRGWHLTRHYPFPPMPFGLALGDLPGFVERIPGLRLLDCQTYSSPSHPLYMRLAMLLSNGWIKRRIAPGLIHLAF